MDFDSCDTRRRDWGDLVTIHDNSCAAYVWRSSKKSITNIVLKQAHWRTNAMNTVIDRRNLCSAVCISACGNYAIVGHKGGRIYSYNLQSGLARGSFPYSNEGGLQAEDIAKRESTPGNVLYEQKKILEVEEDTKEPTPEITNITVTGHSDEVTGLFVNITSLVLVSCSMGK